MAPPRVLALALATIFPALASGEVEFCPSLSAEGKVSYKGQEAKIFRRVVERVELGAGESPPADQVARMFAACFEKFRGDADSEPLAALRVESLEKGKVVGLSRDGSPPRQVRGKELPRLAARVVREALADAPAESRDALGNQLWFLWIESYLRAIGNRYNSYEYADELVAEKAEDRGRSFAVGFEAEVEDGRLLVSEIRDSRLEEGGLLSGDEIVAFDDRDWAELEVPDLQRYWFSPEPFEFRLTVRRESIELQIPGESSPTRHRTTAWAIHDDLGYVRIRRFNRGSEVELRRALRELKAAGVSALILDLRSNPGGSLSPGLVDMFFKPGQMVVSYLDDDDEDPVDIEASVEYWGTPVAILVDRDSASMAEVLAAAFETHRRGVVIGELTVGKGVGQTVVPILDEGRLSLVDRTYFRPGTRSSWNECGIQPTVAIRMEDAQRDLLEPYLDSHMLRLDQQWELDPFLRAAEKALRESP